MSSPTAADSSQLRVRNEANALGASIDYSDPFRCIVLDRSTGGALLRLRRGATAPDEFWLIEIDRGVAYRAAALRRSYPEVTVGLAQPIKLDGRAGDAHGALLALWRAAGGRERATERRRHVRTKSRASGALFTGGDAPAQCTVKNISDGGAKLRVSPVLELRRNVGLLLIHRGFYFDAELVWRAKDEAGIAFRATHRVRGPLPSRMAQARALWRRSEADLVEPARRHPEWPERGRQHSRY